jgi:uncharacterized protein YndB with AHSA1/START domain
MTTTKDIHHTVRINAKPSAVYEALMDSKKHTAFTGAPAKISRAVGGPFTAHGPHLKGINVDLTKNKRIVQAWRAADWPKGTIPSSRSISSPPRPGPCSTSPMSAFPRNA